MYPVATFGFPESTGPIHLNFSKTPFLHDETPLNAAWPALMGLLLVLVPSSNLPRAFLSEKAEFHFKATDVVVEYPLNQALLTFFI